MLAGRRGAPGVTPLVTNLSFGLAGPRCGQSSSIRSRVERLHGGEVRFLRKGPSVLHGALGDGGAVMGTAVDGDLSLVYHGLFWNRLPEWPGGSTPIDHPDTTASYLLERFRRRDVGFLDGLSGQFSATVVDASNGRLVLGCEGAGMRRLFVHRRGDEVLFASKLSAMVALLGDDAEVDRGLEDFLLGFEFLPWGRTVYKGVEILDAGSVLDWRAGEASVRTLERATGYADRWEGVQLDDEDDGRAGDLLHDALQETLDEQIPSAGRVGVLLGGFDSALVAALLVGRGKKVETFSFSFDRAGYNQPLVDEAVRGLGIEHHWIAMTPEVLRSGLESYATSFHQPASQPHYLIQTAAVCAAMRRRGLLHAFSGDGCDGLFLGYPTVYRRARLIDRLSAIPKPFVRLALAASALPPLEPLLGHPYRLGRNVLQILLRDMPARGHIA
ncbi:MAG: asparagine synthetase B family protein, partial [Acidobacteriota bacterium]